MGSFGERLRREREQRGITLDDVALTTKIRAGLLKALEEEKFEQLPGGIFNKGFVRAYARHLGIDEEQAVADYLVASGEAPILRRTSDVDTGHDELPQPRIQLVSEEREKGHIASTPWGMKAGLLLLVVVGVAAWFYYHSETHSDTTSGPVTSGTPIANAPSNPAPTTSSPSLPQAVQNPTLPSSQSDQVAAGNPPIAGTFTVRIRADEDCWMKISTDGKTEEVTLPSNGEKVVVAKDKIILRAGNIGALNITFEGKRLPAQGEYGEVKTLSFSPKGLEIAIPSSVPQ